MSSSTTNVSVVFTGGVNLGPVQRFELREEESKHELVMVDFIYNSTFLLPAEQSPVYVVWAADEETRIFYGYVTNTEHLPTAPYETVRVYMTGTSTPMNNPDPRSWSNVTASFVAKEVAQRAGLRCVLHRTTRILPFVSSETGGDFSMMQRLAEDEGFLFWVDGATMYFLDPTILVSLQNDASVISLWADAEDTTASTVLELHRVSGPQAHLANDAYTRVSFGIGPNNKLVKSTSNPAIPGLNTSPITRIAYSSARSQQDADQANAAAARRADWAHVRAIVAGSPIFTIGKLTNLDGPSVSKDLKGLWQIRSATHVIARQNNLSAVLVYTCEIDIARNGPLSLSYLQKQNLAATSTTAAVLRNGETWQSPSMGAIYV